MINMVHIMNNCPQSYICDDVYDQEKDAEVLMECEIVQHGGRVEGSGDRHIKVPKWWMNILQDTEAAAAVGELLPKPIGGSTGIQWQEDSGEVQCTNTSVGLVRLLGLCSNLMTKCFEF